MCCTCDPWFWLLVCTCCGCMDTEREQLQAVPLPPVELKKVSANPFSATGLPKDTHLNSVYN